MSDVYVLTVGYVRLAFTDAERALRVFELLADTAPVEAVSSYGSPHVPDELKRVCYVRDKDMMSLELKRFDSEQFSGLTADEFREQLKPRPVEPDDGPPTVEPSAAAESIL